MIIGLPDIIQQPDATDCFKKMLDRAVLSTQPHALCAIRQYAQGPRVVPPKKYNRYKHFLSYLGAPLAATPGAAKPAMEAQVTKESTIAHGQEVA